MTISRDTEGKLFRDRTSISHSQSQTAVQKIHAAGCGMEKNQSKPKLDCQGEEMDTDSDHQWPVLNWPSIASADSANVYSHRRNTRVSDYPKATLFQRPPRTACDNGDHAQGPSNHRMDKNYFGDNFLDIPNPVPSGDPCSSQTGSSTCGSDRSDNEAFSDEGSESLRLGNPAASLRLCNSIESQGEVDDTDQDIRRLTLASDSINHFHTSEQDFDSLLGNFERLRESGWFYENITRHQAKHLLRYKSLGSFIIRESTDPKHLFSLSVRTQRGTTSARIEYTNGRFRLDCEDSIRHHMPVFSCVVKLVNFYIKMGKKGSRPNPCVWLESTGRRDMPVRLAQPVRKEMPSLRHMCRLSIANAVTEAQDSLFPNQEVEMIGKLPLPNPLIKYLQRYPYPH